MCLTPSEDIDGVMGNSLEMRVRETGGGVKVIVLP